MSGSDNKNDSLKEIIFNLTISREDYLSYYRGQVKWVVAKSVCGRKVQFPANLLTSHVTHDGIQGRFVLQYLASGKAVKLSRIA